MPAVEPCRRSDTIFCDDYERLQPGTTTGGTTWVYDSNGQRYSESSSAGIRYFGPGGYEQLNGSSLMELGPVVVKDNNAKISVIALLPAAPRVAERQILATFEENGQARFRGLRL